MTYGHTLVRMIPSGLLDSAAPDCSSATSSGAENVKLPSTALNQANGTWEGFSTRRIASRLGTMCAAPRLRRVWV